MPSSGKDSLAGSKDRLIDPAVRRKALLEWRKVASAPSDMVSGADSPISVRHVSGTGVLGSTGSPLTMPSRWVQARGTTFEHRVAAAARRDPAPRAELVGQTRQRPGMRHAAHRG